MLYINVGYRVPFNWTVLYINSYLYILWYVAWHWLVVPSADVTYRFAQIDRLIVQVPRIVKEPGTFSLLKCSPGTFSLLKCSSGTFSLLKCSPGTFSLFKVLPLHAFSFETGHSVNHVYFCLLRDGCIYSGYIHRYICKCYVLYAGFELWYPVDAPLPHFWVSQWVK